jgi:hypothetical protein
MSQSKRVSSARVNQILELTSRLSRDELQEVTAELLAGLEPDDEVTGEAWNAAWADEIQRRASDGSSAVAWEDAREQLDARLAEIRAERTRR